MHSLTHLSIPTASSLILLIVSTSLPVQAAQPGTPLLRRMRGQDQGQSVSVPPATQLSTGKEVPILMVRIDRSSHSKTRRPDPITLLANTLQSAVDESGKFQVIFYSPDQPGVKRALLEHSLSVSDLIEPIQPEALERIAHAVGAHYALLLHPTVLQDGIDSELTFLTDSDLGSWRTALTDHIATSFFVGHRRLKPDAVAAVTVDAITARLGFPSRLADKLHIVPDRIVRLSPAKADKEKTDARSDRQSSQQAAASTEKKRGRHNKSDQGNGTAVRRSDGLNKPDTNGERNAGDGATSKVVEGQKPTNGLYIPLDKAPEKIDLPAIRKPRANKSSRGRSHPGKQMRNPIVSQAPSIASLPVQHNAPTRPEYAQMALRSRQSGDLASAITYYRRAINEEPYDASLRQQLILVYLQRHLVDIALEEAQRAQALMPQDSLIGRVYGDTLYARGDISGALKVYRELIQHAPQDIGARVALADALLADSQYAEALRGYEEATKIDPKSPLPHRRLARVYAERAGGDSTQYQESLHQLELSRTLTPPTDVDSYQGDYLSLMHQLDIRMRDMANGVQSLYEAAIQGKKQPAELQRVTADMKERAGALSDYLDKVTPAAGLDEAHNHYSQAAALLLQEIGTFRRTLNNNGLTLQDVHATLQVARADTFSELATAAKLMEDARTSRNTTDRPETIQK